MFITDLFNTRKKALAIILLVALIMTIMPKVSFAANGTFGIEMLVNKTDVYSGEVFTYTIKYSYSSGTTDAQNVVIVDQLSPELDFVEAISSIDVASVNETNGKVTFTFKNPLKAGTTGTLKIKAKFKDGIIPSNKTVLNKASITGDEVESPSSIEQQISNEVSVTVNDPVTDWYVEKVKVNPAGVPALNSDVKYKITVYSNSNVGGLNLKDIVITDTFEEKADIVSTTGYVENNTVTWNLNSLNAGTQKSFYITLNYPSEFFCVNSEAGKKQTATNSVMVTAKNYDDSDAGSDSDSVNHNFADPSYSIGDFDKDGRPGISEGNDEYSLGQEAQFYIKGITNTSNVAIDNFIITDSIPAEIKLTEISTGSFSYSDGNVVNVSYKTQVGTEPESDWKDWATLNTDNNTTLDARLITLAAGERISAVKWNYGTVPAGFSLTGEGIKVFGTILSGLTITNTAYLAAGGLTPKQASETINIISEIPWITASKSALNSNEFYEEEFVEFKLQVTNHSYATGQYNTPIIVEELLSAFDPASFEYLGWYDTNGSYHTDAEDAALEPTITSYQVSGNDCYKWTFNGTVLQPGESVAVRIKAQILLGTLAGFVDNNMYVTTSIGEFKSSASIQDTLDYDNDSLTSDKLVKDTEKIFVKFKGSLKSEKWVKGELDSDWSYYSNPETFAHGQTLPGGIADYKLKVSNAGSNGPIANIVVVDVLPYLGDKELVSGNDRESAWRPNLVNQIEFVEGSVRPSGFKIWYSVEPESPDTWQVPDLKQVEKPTDKTSFNTGWTETLPDDITSVRALKFDFGDLVLNSGEEIILSWPMRAPVGAPKDIIAWNSFMYGATYPDVSEGVEIQEPFLKAEPQKVGFKIFDPGAYPANLGDFIWEDMNKNGIQEDGEPGINGVLVELFKEGETTPLKYTRSGDSYSSIFNSGKPGYYLFPNLPTGQKYFVKFTLPTGYEDYLLTLYKQGTEDKDSDIDPANAELTTELITLIGDNLDLDLGLYRKASIGDIVWNDRDMDGVQDNGEPGLSGITVELYDESKSYLDTTTTDANGNYKFSLLDPGNYYIKFINDGNYKFSPINAGQVGSVDIATDSDADTITGYSTVIEVKSGDNIEDIDAGMYLAELGDLVWEDKNANGIQDSGENGISGVTVSLYNNSSHVGDTTTDSSGKYKFIDLIPSSSYEIRVTKPTGFDEHTSQNSGSDDIDSDVNGAGVISVPVINAGDRNYTLDAGYFKYASLGDFIWNDLNHNGKQDTGEPGIDLVANSIELFKNGILVSKTETNASGKYSFTGLIPGDYKIQVNIPTQYIVTNQNAVSDSQDSDINSSGEVTGITLTSGQTKNDIDGGLHQALVGNYVWEDKNGDGQQNDSSSGISGVSVKLLDKDSNELITTTTDSNGYYLFTDLSEGEYIVEFSKPSSAYNTTTKGTGTASDSDVNDVTQRTDVFDVTKGQTRDDIDAGYWLPTSIGNFIWYEVDGDGLQGGTSEIGIDNVTVKLFKDGSDTGKTCITGSTSVPNNITLNQGEYRFDNLAPGNYHIEVTLPADYNGFIDADKGSNEIDSDADSTGKMTQTLLESGEDDYSWDAGLYKSVYIGNRVWEDINANGYQDAGEPNYSDSEAVTIKAYRFGTEVDSVTTTDGDYGMINLAPGLYQLEVSVPSGYLMTLQDQGGNDITSDVIDSDSNRTTLRTESFQIDSTTNDDTWDFGLYKKNSIGDRVWLDVNGNNIQDKTGGIYDEAGLAGITVYLLDSSNNIITSTVTDADGMYLFDDLYAGNYKIGIREAEIENHAGKKYLVTKENVGSDDEDSDISTTKVDIDSSSAEDFLYLTGIYTLESDNNIESVDIGLYEPASIGDFVWEDKNADGIQDSGESGISGIVQIKLYDADTDTFISAMTPANGIYKFSDLDAGNYYIEFSTSLEISPQNNTDDHKDSDVYFDSSSNMKRTGIINLLNGQQRTDIDAGFYSLCSVGNYIWEDTDGDGVQDSSEPAVDGVAVQLLQGGSVKATTTTDENGQYSFTDLVPNTYQIRVLLPTGYDGFIGANKGGDNNKDSDVNDSGVTTENIILTSGTDDMSWDAGLYKYATIGDTIWYDADVNGTQDDSNLITETVTVELIKVESGIETSIDTINTNTGSYSFNGLLPGNYIVKFTTPPNYHITTINGAGDDTLDSDADASNLGRIAEFNLKSGTTDNTRDCGMYKGNSLGDRVWEDLNGNGVQDTGELGIAGIEISLYNDLGTDLGITSTTNVSGNYLFNNLPAGTYKIGIKDIDLGDYHLTNHNATDDDNDSDVDNSTKLSGEYTLTSNNHIDSADIGLYKLGSLGNYIWLDTNGDGQQGNAIDEPPIEGVTITLKKGGIVKGTYTTLADGLYEFTDLTPGDYELTFSPDSGYHFTTSKLGSDDLDSDTNSEGKINYSLQSNETNMNLDAGLVRHGVIGDYVWLDSNKNGIQDSNEKGLADKKVKLINTNGTTMETTTNSNGIYRFDSLQPGEYQVQFYPQGDLVLTKENEGADDSKDSNPDRSTGITPKFNLLSGEVIESIDAGMYLVPQQELKKGEGSIGDYVWIDSNKDGIQDANEKGISGVKVILSPKNADRIETYTDSNGKYLFDLLPDGLYSVRVEEPVGYKTTIRSSGNNRDLDSDANKNGFIEVVRLTDWAKIRNIDIGLIGTAELGDFVWNDLNGNGSQDFGEPGIEDVTVYLLDNNKNTIMQTKTDKNGNYTFTELVPGIYFIKIDIPQHLEMTLLNNGTQYKDNDGNPEGVTKEIVLKPGQKRTDIDFGLKKLIPQGEIGNYIWADCSDDGIQDNFENGVANITVKLLDENKTVVDSTVTDENGYYLFSKVLEGDYYISVELPDGISTTKRYATSEDKDSNVSVSGLSDKISLTQNQKDMSIDIGLVKYSNIEGVITDDKTGEPLANCEVVVKNRKGRVITTLTTDKEGRYIIENISMCMEISLEVIKNPDQQEHTNEDSSSGGEGEVPDNIEIDGDEIPLGTIKELPNTGASRNIGIYIVGMLFILVGIGLRKKSE